MNNRTAMLIILLAVSIGAANGQNLDIPTLNTDAMSHLQSEMPSLLERYKYVYFNFIFAIIGENTWNPDTGAIAEWKTVESIVLGGIFGGKIPINSMFSIPLFSTFHLAAASDQGAYETFTGSGLQIDHDLWGGGVFVGYYTRQSESPNDPFPFRIAFTPSVKASRLGTVGRVLDEVMGFIGMGEVVSASEDGEKDDVIDGIVRGLNWGLDIAFSRIDLSPAELSLRALYRRDNYAVGAKNDTFGAVLGFTRNKFEARLEAGYKHFYAVARSLEGSYFDTGYIDISAGFNFTANFSIGAIYKYDAITLHRFGLIINLFKQSVVAYRGEQDTFFTSRFGY